MPFVKCSVNGCSKRLQPILKVDPEDRSTWLYPECDVCLRPVCDKHAQEVEGEWVCDICRQEFERPEIPLLDLGIKNAPTP